MIKGIERKNSGITLIALIITIIIMLILAGVSINAIVGDNGILTNAIEAARLADITDIKEQIELALLGRNSNGTYTKDDVKEVALEITGNEVEENEDGTYTVLTEKGNEVDLTDLFESAYVYVDKKSPTVDIEIDIDGNNLTVTVIAEDDVGIESYVYYLDDEEETEATGDSYEFTSLSDGSHTIKVVVIDTSGNETEKEVAVVIDTRAPTVAITTTPDTDSITVEVTASDDNGISSYEYYLDGDLIEISSDDSYIYKGLTSGTEYTIKVIVYDNSGNKNEVSKTETTEEEAVIVGASDISSNASTYYGSVVTNYTVADEDYQDVLEEEGIEWKIFYAGKMGEGTAYETEDHIYLIASDYIPSTVAPSSANYSIYVNSTYKLSFNNVHLDYTLTGSASISESKLQALNSSYYTYLAGNMQSSNNTNICSVAYMMDTSSSVWGKYANTKYAEYAIGGPTLEMLFQSYNEKYNTDIYQVQVSSKTGYQVSVDGGSTFSNYFTDSTYYLDSTDSLYVISSTTKASYMWLASTSAVNIVNLMGVSYSGSISTLAYNNASLGLRPLVCLTSDIQLESNGDDTYSIVE